MLELPSGAGGRARHERYMEMQAEFAEQVRRFRETVAMYNWTVVRRGRRQLGGFETFEAPTARQHEQRLPNGQAGPSTLTPRQLDIAQLIARGYTNQQIADCLVLTPGTVANHVQHILERLGLRSRTQVAVWWSQQPVQRSPARRTEISKQH